MIVFRWRCSYPPPVFCEIKNKKESSLIQRKSGRQAIFEFVLSSASGGAGGGKYILNLIICYPVKKELIRRCLEKFLLS